MYLCYICVELFEKERRRVCSRHAQLTPHTSNFTWVKVKVERRMGGAGSPQVEVAEPVYLKFEV